MDNHKEYWKEVERKDPGRIKLRSVMYNYTKMCDCPEIQDGWVVMWELHNLKWEDGEWK